MTQTTNNNLHNLSTVTEQKDYAYLSELVAGSLRDEDTRKYPGRAYFREVEIDLSARDALIFFARYPREQDRLAGVAKMITGQVRKRGAVTECLCGCGTRIKASIGRGRMRWFARGHSMRAVNFSFRGFELDLIDAMIAFDEVRPLDLFPLFPGRPRDTIYKYLRELVSIGAIDRVRVGVYALREETRKKFQKDSSEE